ncbi:zf-CCHC domain-containing protein/MP domain-containing protein [Cucumis melo var. makuwa]|uniref:Zf-CCHC domain-containing protein/MP domain-containing protein n=1 Tax=Cucumis melo var. makuwa TaxID=1194695 RepID=A0A5D3DES6_CUCMM|nr:zf-CCHC domain-containing protein/MP domain-containing protein [Cucumis melo var. makuwa]TYK22043.1 zf-CCHC domain-containing protein/MP domain-containing protein [Cucumis melo var. makuwa]
MTTNSVTKQINWSELTFGDISATVQAICINLCIENKHTTKVIKDSDYRKELGTFCKQYGLDRGPKEKRKKKKKSSNKRLFSKGKICYKCNRKGHYSNRCPLKDKINALTIDEETRQSILYAIRLRKMTHPNLNPLPTQRESTFLTKKNLLVKRPSPPKVTQAMMNRKCSGHINVIFKDQETLFDLIDQLPDENSKRDVSNRIKGEAKKPFQIEDFHS